MQITTQSIDNYTSEATVTCEAAELEKEKTLASKQLASRASIPGFRKGKVPPTTILEQYYWKGAILEEASENLKYKARQEIIRKYMPVTEPVISKNKPEEGKDFVFTLTYTPYPEVKLGDYKGLEAEKVVAPVTDEAVEHQIEHILSNNAEMIPAEETATVAKGDLITLDYVGTVDGEKFAGGEGKDRPLEIGSHTFIDGFEEQLIGLKVGEEKDVKVTFPEGYHAKDLAEKPAVFHCKINSIKHKVLPEFNDEFVKKVSKFETVDEYKKSIRTNLEVMNERDALVKQREDVVQQILDSMQVDIPPVMIDNRVQLMIEELDANLQTQGMNLEVYLAGSGRTRDELSEDYRADAEKNLRMDIMLEQVAQNENIEVSNVDINMEIARMSSLYHATPKQIVKALQDNDQIPTVISNIRHQKAMQFIFDNMKGAENSETTTTKTSTDEKPAEEKVESAVDKNADSE